MAYANQKPPIYADYKEVPLVGFKYASIDDNIMRVRLKKEIYERERKEHLKEKVDITNERFNKYQKKKDKYNKEKVGRARDMTGRSY